MLVFVVPLKSRRVAKSWDYVTRLFERCLKSICAQTAPDFKAVVVCHDKPAIAFSHPAVVYVSVDFPAPESALHRSLNDDKQRKLAAGYRLARTFAASHVMGVDADDCVSNRLAEFVRRNPEGYGWRFDSGYFYPDGARRIYLKKSGFYDWCGSSNIVRRDLLDRLDAAALEASDSALLKHPRVNPTLAAAGTPLAPLPFPGAVYVGARNGEGNHSRRTFLQDLRRRPRIILHMAEQRLLQRLASVALTPELAAEFGLYPLTGAAQDDR